MRWCIPGSVSLNLVLEPSRPPVILSKLRSWLTTETDVLASWVSSMSVERSSWERSFATSLPNLAAANTSSWRACFKRFRLASKESSRWRLPMFLILMSHAVVSRRLHCTCEHNFRNCSLQTRLMFKRISVFFHTGLSVPRNNTWAFWMLAPTPAWNDIKPPLVDPLIP